MDRREFVWMSTFLAVGIRVPALNGQHGSGEMYGLIGKIIAVEGSRDQLAEVLLEGITGMPRCRSYVVAEDVDDPDALWVTEVWETEAAHQASLSLPSVQEAIRQGRPLIAGFGERYVTAPLGGHGMG